MEFKTGINRQTSASSLYAYASLYKHAKRNDRAGVVTFEEKGRAFGRRQCWRKVAEKRFFRVSFSLSSRRFLIFPVLSR